jgi:hypothetical protein
MAAVDPIIARLVRAMRRFTPERIIIAVIVWISVSFGVGMLEAAFLGTAVFPMFFPDATEDTDPWILPTILGLSLTFGSAIGAWCVWHIFKNKIHRPIGVR